MQPTTPSVLVETAEPTPLLSDVNGLSSLSDESSSSNRRQRISMACQYCRHRKIRCCGGSPCRNCSRSQRECEYAPVPDDVNKATREKKALAKASRTPHFVSPATCYSPYFVDTPVLEVSYVPGPQSRQPHLAHRRSVSVPNFEAQSWNGPPPAPLLRSPPMIESSQWMYNGWDSAPCAPAPFPSVLEQTPAHSYYLASQGTSPHSRAPSVDVEMPTSYSTPNLLYQGPALTPNQHRSPITPVYYSPYPTPPVFQLSQTVYSSSPLGPQASVSPTLAPEMSASYSVNKDLIGLGIGVTQADAYHTSTLFNEEYFATPHF